jgi:hypothetical protein
MAKGVPWRPTDLVGGPVDHVFMALRDAYPGLRIVRLSVTHPADDDNVWFITPVDSDTELQLDSMPNGYPPFLLESDHARERADEVAVAVDILSEWLRG